MSFQGSKINPSKFDKSQIKFYIFLIPLGIFMALPIVYIISTAFKPFDELFAYPPRFFPRKISTENFEDVMKFMAGSSIPFSRYLMNSIISSVITVAACVFFSLSSGYTLSKKRFKAKKLLFAVNTVSLMFVPAAVGIPRYLLVEKSGMIDTFPALILPMISMPVGLFLLKQFIDQVPDSLIESARIDGAREFTILRKIVAPIVKPAMATVAIIAFQAAWNTPDPSVYYINNDALKTFAFFVKNLSILANTVEGRGMVAAASLILFIPNLIIFIIMQSRVLNTMAHSGIK